MIDDMIGSARCYFADGAGNLTPGSPVDWAITVAPLVACALLACLFALTCVVAWGAMRNARSRAQIDGS